MIESNRSNRIELKRVELRTLEKTERKEMNDSQEINGI